MDEDGSNSGSGPVAPDGDERERAEPGREPQETWSWLGCLWIVVVPLVLLGAVVVTLNWLGC